MASAVQAGPACFSAPEQEAAHLRVVQQQFQVAALNCQTADPADPTFAMRYNRFVELFGVQLQSNSEALYHHFGKGSKELDRWITRIANDAGQQVITNPDFCQVNYDRLDLMVTLAPADMLAYAAKTEAASGFAPLCPEKKAKPAKSAKATKDKVASQ